MQQPTTSMFKTGICDYAITQPCGCRQAELIKTDEWDQIGV